ncbi:ABC transporter substrate-binding protein [Curtobacterium flaccumfaciens]|nr:ABC transporter substrate-binding protein [Curtobacterium flaccumfaciens]
MTSRRASPAPRSCRSSRGTATSFSAEAILALRPTVLLTDSSLGPWDVVLQVRNAGIPVVVVDSHRDTSNIDEIIDQVATALGVPETGERLASEVHAQQAAVAEQVQRIAPTATGDKLRMVFLYVRGTPASTTCSARSPGPTRSSTRSAVGTSRPSRTGRACAR